MTGATNGTVYQRFQVKTPRFRTNQPVVYSKKPETTYRIAACYKVEIWYFYKLVNVPGLLFEESTLKPLEDTPS